MLSFFLLFKEFIIGSKLSIQLLQILRIDDFFFSKNAFYVQQYCFDEWRPTNVASIVSRFFWQSYCLWGSGQSFLPLITSSVVTCKLRLAFSRGNGKGVHLGPSDQLSNGQCGRGLPSFPHSLAGCRLAKEQLPDWQQKSWGGQCPHSEGLWT